VRRPPAVAAEKDDTAHTAGQRVFDLGDEGLANRDGVGVEEVRCPEF
jgi:hypothetical protein